MRHADLSLPAAVLAVASTLAFAVAPSTGGTAGPDLETAPYIAEDPAGDANLVNGQGLLATDPVPDTPTGPASVAEADVLGVRITSRYDEVTGSDGLVDRVLTGLEFRTALSADPIAGGVPLFHRVVGTVDGCRLQVNALTTDDAAGGTSATIRMFEGCGAEGDDETVTDGLATPTWDAEFGELVVALDLAAADPRLQSRLTRDTYYQVTNVHTRIAAGASGAYLTIPQLDHMEGGYAQLGSDIPDDEQPSGDDGGTDDGGTGDGGTGDGGTGDGGTGDGGGHSSGGGNDVPRDTRPVCGRYDGGSVGTTATQGSDRTGVEEHTLTLGLHAPATGAAPVPTTSYEKGRDLYWRAVTEDCRETVLGRSQVDVDFYDDKYDPNSAGQVCRELSSRAFLVAGGAGTDQIQRCGQLAAVGEFPYLSAGVTEAGLADNPWYFAATMSFREQGGLLAGYAAANPDGIDVLGPGAAIGTIATNTPNYDDAVHGWRQGLADNGLQSRDTYRYAKGDSSWYADTARRFHEAGIEVVYFLGSPIDLLRFADTADSRFGYNPLYVGIASDTSLDAVLAAGCDGTGRRVDGSIWLSGTPGLDAAPTAFLDAAQRFGAPSDDIALRLWAFAEQQHELLEGYEELHGQDLTREDFRAFVEDSGIRTEGTFPAATWSQGDHFPSQAMHVLQADCETEQHVTLHVDAAGF